MNSNLFKTVFSQRLGALIAVGEHTSGQGKATGGHGAGHQKLWNRATAGASYFGVVSMGFAFVTLAWSAPANNALPSGGQVAQGAAAISQSGANMAIHQSTARAVVNWQSFDIGKDAKVNIVQPNAQAVLLNRVTGVAPSQIFGQMSANGQVVLVNPNGVTFGKDGSVSAAGLTASTLNISDADFMAGRKRFTRDGATGEVVNQGTLTAAPGGYVALLGASVSNEGQIYAPQGNVALGAADAITLPMTGTGRIKMALSPSAINAAVANQKGGTIVTEGGQVYMQVAAMGHVMASVLQSGSIDTSAEQGGAVHLLADGGHIRVDGSIKANSTQGTAGGDIYIGRDKDTNVLAAVGDVSGARLESKGGFVETSGQYLVTTGTRVLAKDWLLDPYNITIAPSGPSGTAYSSTYNPGADSLILASDIAANLNSGTSVNIQTGLAGSPGLSDGNIVVNAAIVKSGSSDASLTLTANNGITVNQRIGRAATDATSSGKLNVVMTANGDATSTSNSQGIALNNVIDANGGQVTLTGTSKNTSGVQLGPTYTYGVTNNSLSGVVFNNGSGITADNFQVTGTHTVAAGNSFGVNGVYLNGSVTFKATGNTDSNITGNSNAQGNFGAGVSVWDAATVGLENQGTGVTTVKGSNTNTAGGNGVRVSANASTAVINAMGRVTIGQQTVGVNAPTFVRGTINVSQNTSNLSGLSILGQTGLNTSAVQIWDTTISATGIDVVVDGVSANGTGVNIQNPSNTTWTTRNLTVTGVANTTSGSSGSGVVVQRLPNFLTVNASGNIAILGTVQGAGTGRGLHFAESGWGAQVPRLIATGNITLRGNNRASATNVFEAVYIASGVQVTAGGNILVQGETNNTAANAIHFYSAATASTAWNTAGASALQGNTTLQATGNVLVQSNQGGILLNNQLSSTLNNGGTPLLTSDTKITGKNITFDNTGAGMTTGASNTLGSGSIDSTTGAITAGSGRATGTNTNVINFADNRAIHATGNLNIMGASTSGDGVRSIAKMEAGESLTIAGQTQSAAHRAVVITNNGALNGTLKVTDGKTINIHANTLTLGGAATAVDAGTTGTVNIKTGTSGNEIVMGAADTLSTTLASQKLGIDQSELNRINAGHLVIGDTASTGKITVSGATTTAATTGNITLQTGGNIEVNAVLTAGDDPGTTATVEASKTLTLNATGANSAVSQTAAIKAAGLELRGANATHTLTNTGNDIQKLAGNTKTVSLTNNQAFAIDTVNTAGLSTSGNTTLSSTAAVTQAQAINAAGLELLGTGGSYTLNNANNTVQKLAGNTGSVALTHQGDLEVDTVNTTGLSATGDVSITTAAGSTPGHLTLKQNITGANVNLNATGSLLRDGNATASATSLLRIKAGGGIGTSTSRIQTDVATLSMESAGDQYVTEANAITVAAKSTAGSVNIDATTGALTVGSSTLIDGTTAIDGVSAATGVVVTAQAGDLSITQTISNSASGDVVLGAGVASAAGAGLTSNVKTTLGAGVSNTGTGKLHVYTGSSGTGATGALSNLDASLSDLYLSAIGSNGQNADSFVKYDPSSMGISGAGTTAQVMFREKVALELTRGVSVNPSYGDANTQNDATSQTALWTTVKNALGAANGTVDKSTDTGAFHISGAALANDLSEAALSNASYSGTGYLKYTENAYNYGSLIGNKYAPVLSNDQQLKVAVAKKTVSLDSITAAHKTYDGSTTASILSGTFSGTVTGETLAISGSGSFLDKNVANGKTVTIADVTTLTPANGSGDWANYSLSTTGSLSTSAHITPKSVTLDAIVAAHKTYDGNTVAAITSGVISGTAAGETLSVTGVGVFADKNAASGIAVNVADVTALTPANGSGNWANYTLTTTGAASTTANITKASLQAALTGTVEKTYDGTTVANNLSNSHFALTGWVGSEGASISQVKSCSGCRWSRHHRATA